MAWAVMATMRTGAGREPSAASHRMAQVVFVAVHFRHLAIHENDVVAMIGEGL